MLPTLPINPIPALITSGDPALVYFTRRDLVGETVNPVETLWELSEAQRILIKQQPDGRWRYPGKTGSSLPGQNYDLLETFRQLGILVEQFGFTRRHPAIEKAAGYIFACQTAEGDIRGILSNQYMPYYHGMILAQLIQAEYGDEPRVQRGLEWLLSIRQADGGWVVPFQGIRTRTPEMWAGTALKADPGWHSSHLATGMALRAFAVHPKYCANQGVLQAAGWLKGRFFQPDFYGDRRAPEYWLKFQYPFWWPNLLTVLDCLGRMGFSVQDPEINKGLSWFIENQDRDGLWPTGYGSGRRAEPMRRWVGLAIGRMLRIIGNFSFS